MKTNTKIPGLSVEFSQSCARLYATVYHVSSGKAVIKFNKAPLPFGKREFVKHLDSSVLTEIDWTQDEETLATKEIFDIVLKAQGQVLEG